MKLDNYNKDQLQAIVTHLTDEHPYLAAEVTQFARSAGYDDIDLKKMKSEMRELVNSYKSGGHIDRYAMQSLGPRLAAMVENQLGQVEDTGDLLTLAEYVTFAWQYVKDTGEKSEGFTQQSKLSGMLEEAITGCREQIRALGPVKVKRIVAKYMKRVAGSKRNPIINLFWLDETLALVQDSNQLQQIKQAIADVEKEYPYFGVLPRLIVRLHEDPETIHEIATRALKDERILDWYLDYLARDGRTVDMINILEKRLTKYPHSVTLSNKSKLDKLYQMLPDADYYEFVMRTIRQSAALPFSAKTWLTAHPDYRAKFMEAMHGTTSKLTAETRINLLAAFAAWPEIITILNAGKPNAHTSARLEFFQELYSAGLTDVAPLFDFFVQGLGHMSAAASDRYDAVLRAMVELARVSGDKDRFTASMGKIRELYPRKAMLLFAIPRYERELDNKRLRRFSLGSAARFAFKPDWPLKWENQ
ncbi:hypothetical protein [Lacticaseibacillus hulanensis]|uniref:hypothetical protein n=1 Tax=Lacticaseibacillus hulanensis TaxID=2493111 RepID=UPI000FD8DB23|nr:hypothetical protein [Lacticaseibacillus hulanensis]